MVMSSSLHRVTEKAPGALHPARREAAAADADAPGGDAAAEAAPEGPRGRKMAPRDHLTPLHIPTSGLYARKGKPRRVAAARRRSSDGVPFSSKIDDSKRALFASLRNPSRLTRQEMLRASAAPPSRWLSESYKAL